MLANSGCRCRKRKTHSLPILSYTFTCTSLLFRLIHRSLMISANSHNVSYRGGYPEIVKRVIHRTNSFSSACVRFWSHSWAKLRGFFPLLTQSYNVRRGTPNSLAAV